MQAENLLSSLPKDLDNEVFEALQQSSHVKIERIVSKGHTSPASGWHQQEQHEWVILLQGAACIRYANGEEYKLSLGSYLNIPAQTRHRVTFTAVDTETVWLAIHYV
jgi:cupin 2 domain-containing protein